jgi:hypothetical protein
MSKNNGERSSSARQLLRYRSRFVAPVTDEHKALVADESQLFEDPLRDRAVDDICCFGASQTFVLSTARITALDRKRFRWCTELLKEMAHRLDLGGSSQNGLSSVSARDVSRP